MNSMMRKLMLSCKKATELIEKKNIAPLGRIEAIQLTFHKKMCKVCSAYEVQSHFLSKAIDKQFELKSENQEEKLSEEAKKRIIENLIN